MSRLLVTGGSGFLGQALVRRLLAQNLDVASMSSIDGDIAQPRTLEKFSGGKFDRVVHLAARTFVPDSWTDPAAFYSANVLGTANVAQFCKANGAALTFISAYVYGEPESLPVREDAPAEPNNPYALSKHLAEEICRFHALRLGVPTTILRPFNIYGPAQGSAFLIPSLVSQALHAAEIRVNDLLPRRDYVFVEDVVDAIVRTLSHSDAFSVYNIGSGASLSVQEVVDAVQAVAGTSKPVVSAHLVRQNEIQDVVADISLATMQLGWTPGTPFHEGIRKVVDWQRQVLAVQHAKEEV